MKNLTDYSRVVRFGETDAGGVVYFAELLRFCHEAYEEGLAAAGVDVKAFFSRDGVSAEKDCAIAVPIVHTQADFYRPMFCGDRITISLAPKLLTPDSFEITYKVFESSESANGRKVAKALTRHVAIQTASRHRCPLPGYLTDWIAAQSEPSELI